MDTKLFARLHDAPAKWDLLLILNIVLKFGYWSYCMILSVAVKDLYNEVSEGTWIHVCKRVSYFVSQHNHLHWASATSLMILHQVIAYWFLNIPNESLQKWVIIPNLSGTSVLSQYWRNTDVGPCWTRYKFNFKKNFLLTLREK